MLAGRELHAPDFVPVERALGINHGPPLLILGERTQDFTVEGDSHDPLPLWARYIRSQIANPEVISAFARHREVVFEPLAAARQVPITVAEHRRPPGIRTLALN